MTIRGTVLCTRLVPAFAAAAMLVYGTDQWSNRDYSQWTSEDLQKILTDSPWSRPVKAGVDQSMRRSNDPDMPNAGAGGNAGSGGPMDEGGGLGRGGIGGIGGLGRGGGGLGNGGGLGRGGMGRPPRTDMPSPTVTVRWDSALPVRQALLRLYGGEEGARQEAFRKNLDQAPSHYVITLIGLSSGGETDGVLVYDRDEDSPNHGARRNRPQTPDEIRQDLKASSRLVRKDKDPISPEEVKSVEGPGGEQQIKLLFPKSDAIRLEDKEVTFQTRVGPLRVERKFKLKEMTYRNSLEL